MSISQAEKDQITSIAQKLGILPSSSATTPNPIAESMPRASVTTVTSTGTLTTGTLQMVALSIPAGQVITAISFMAGTTAESSGTHAWMALYDKNLNLLGQTADNTAAAAVSASTLFTASLTTAYTTTYSGLYYAAFNVTATTPNTLMGAVSATAITNIVPIISGTSTTSLLGIAPLSAAALTAITGIPYAFVS